MVKAKVVEKKKKVLPAVPEVLLKRRKKRNELRFARIKSISNARAARRVKRTAILKKAEVYSREYLKLDRDDIQIKRDAKAEGSVIIPAESKLAFVIRIRGINQIHPKVRKVLKLFRLRQINNGVFIKLNKATINMLRIAEPYIAWGYPNVKSIKSLLYKRGCGTICGRRIPITHNDIIEKQLKKINVTCIEDMVHELYTVGPNFTKVAHFLWPFKLNNPTGGWRKKTNHFVEGGDFGNREYKINTLLAKMV